MTAVYVEQDCILEIEGHSYESGGAVVTPEHVIAYMGKSWANVETWHGEELGKCRVNSSWVAPSVWGTKLYSVTMLVDGTFYTGRTRGPGSVIKGKRKAQQNW